MFETVVLLFIILSPFTDFTWKRDMFPMFIIARQGKIDKKNNRFFVICNRLEENEGCVEMFPYEVIEAH